jgi:hypothetical protein
VLCSPCNIMEAHSAIQRGSDVAATVNKVIHILPCQRSTWCWPLSDGQEPYRTWRTDVSVRLSPWQPWIAMVLIERKVWIGHLTNYGQNTYFWTFWTFSYKGKSKNDTKLVSAGRRDLRLSADLAGHRESKKKLNKFFYNKSSIFRLSAARWVSQDP